MSERTPPRPDRVPTSPEEALGLALEHARNAVAEALLAARALLDAASLAVSGKPARLDARSLRGASDARLALATMARGLDELAAALRGSQLGLPDPVVAALLDALTKEIARWEARSQHDADARAVLRAFLGLREMLWELGLRHPGEPQQPGAAHRDTAARAADASGEVPPLRPRKAGAQGDEGTRPRVQRVEVKG